MFTGIYYYFKGLGFLIGKPRLWKYIVIPFIVAVMLFAAIAALMGAGYNRAAEDIVGNKKILFSVIYVISGGIIFIMLNGFLTDYYMACLSEEVEKIVLGSVQNGPEKSIWQIIGEIFSIIKSIPFMLLILLLNFIPIIGQIITFYYAGVANLTFALERRNRTPKEVKKLLGNHRFAIIGFGFLCCVAIAIPPFTLFYRPLNVVGGTLFAIEEVEKLKK